MQLIVCGHGNFATGVTSAAQLIGGEQSALVVIDFIAGMSGEGLRAELNKALSAEPAVIFTDLIGGAPFREAVLLTQQRDDVVVLTGTTVQMLLETFLAYDDIKSLRGDALKVWADELLTNAREGVVAYHQTKPKTKPQNTADDDGI